MPVVVVGEPNLQYIVTEKDLIFAKGYQLGHTIGEGTYSKVKIARSIKKNNPEDVACKIIDKRMSCLQFKMNFLPRELAISRKLNHHNIVSVFEIFETRHFVYIFMEFCQLGDLLDFLKKEGPMSETHARNYFKQILSAIAYLHRLDIAHRDLKCENILITVPDTIKVADFGFSRYCKDKDGHRVLSNTYCGSTSYAPPEVIKGIPYNPTAHDIWSLGCILFAMIAKKQPFDDSNLRRMLDAQRNRAYMFSINFKKCSLLLKRLIYCLLEPDPDQRFTIRKAANSEWLKIRD